MRKLRILAFFAAVAVAAFGAPAASHAFVPDPSMPGVVFPANAGGYQSNTLNVVGYADPLVNIRIVDGTPPCPAAGCGFGAVLNSGAANIYGDFVLPITLADGYHRIYVYANNNVADSVPLVRDFLVDTVAPSAPTITSPNGGETFNSKTVLFAGQAESRAHVVLVDEAGRVRSTTAALDGSWSYAAIFTNGPHTVAAYQDDLAFNQGPFSAPVSFTVDIDVTAPAAPVIISPAQGSLNPSAVTVSGTAEPLSSVKVLEDTVDGLIIYGTTQAGPTGDWSLPLTLLDSFHFLQATATDPSGNESARSPVRKFLVDAIAPTVSIRRAGMYLGGQLFIPGDAITGTARDNDGLASIEVIYTDLFGNVAEDNIATCDGSCTGTSANWSDAPGIILPGVYTVTAIATDQVGNTSMLDQINLLAL